MAIIYILASAFFSLLIAHFLKESETKGIAVIPVLTVNYATATLVAILSNVSSGKSVIPEFPLELWLLAFVVGVFFISNFFVYSKSVHNNGVGVSVTAMRMSLLIPVIMSVIVYNEALTFMRVTGILLVLISLGMLVVARYDIRVGKLNSHWLLVLLFVLTGSTDAALKVFEQHGLQFGSEAHFMSAVFFFSMMIGILVLIKMGRKSLSRSEIKMGILIGVPNLLTSIFLIKALQFADGTVVYSAVNVLTVVGGALIGVLYWKDKLSKLQVAGMLIAIIAILILL